MQIQVSVSEDVLLRLVALWKRAGHQIDYLEAALAAYRPPATIHLPHEIDAFLADCRQRNVREITIRAYRSTLRRLEAPTRDSVVALLANPRLGSWAKKHHLLNLRAFFSYLVRERRMAQNPCDGIRPPLCDSHIEIVPLEAIQRICGTIQKHDPTLLPYFCLLAFAGLRWNEARQIRRQHVRDGYIEVTAGVAKTRSRRLVPIYFSAATAAKVGEATDVRRRLRRIYAQAAVNVPRNALRHTFASMLVAQTQKDPEGIAPSGVLGHSDAVLYRHYRALVSPSVAAEFFAFAHRI